MHILPANALSFSLVYCIPASDCVKVSTMLKASLCPFCRPFWIGRQRHHVTICDAAYSALDTSGVLQI